MSSALHPMLNMAVKAARAAGALLNRAALDVESVRVSVKQTEHFVSEVEQSALSAILDVLLGAYSSYGVWAKDLVKPGKVDCTWVISPIDGLTNFAHGFPAYSVSVALMVGQKIEQAVVYDPSRNDLFCATRGRGAYLNNRRIRVARRVGLHECLLSANFALDAKDGLGPYLQLLEQVMLRCAGVRRVGSSALELAYVAAGLSDGFLELGSAPWEVAAAALLVQEAGGLVGNFRGEGNFLEQRECVAANPKIYSQLIGLTTKRSSHTA